MTAVAASNNSEELILELFDVLERCPASARDAATDLFCLEAIVTAPEKPDAAALKRDVAALRKRCRLDVLDVVMEE